MKPTGGADLDSGIKMKLTEVKLKPIKAGNPNIEVQMKPTGGADLDSGIRMKPTE